jgi:hypothetical protein
VLVRRSARLTAALALGLSALLQVSGPLHYVLVEHRVCAEHGEATHGEAGHHDHGHAVVGDTEIGRPIGAAGLAVGRSDAAEHPSHDHCLLASRPRDAAAAQGAPVAAGRVAPTMAPSRPAPGRAHRAPALQLAPKTSPPRLG